ncbi:MAG: hypothetical protein LC620_00855 [Halobacteriales archaeon]|nr:hypothetical protein [Halobacteriales archaeon]
MTAKKGRPFDAGTTYITNWGPDSINRKKPRPHADPAEEERRRQPT